MDCVEHVAVGQDGGIVPVVVDMLVVSRVTAVREDAVAGTADGSLDGVAFLTVDHMEELR